MSDLLRRVQHLIELSASSSEEEARTAALKACTLIRKHKITLSAETEDDDEPFERTSARGSPRPPRQKPVRVRVPPEVTDIATRAAGRVVTSVLRDLLKR